MGTVYKPTATKPIPEGAERVTRKGKRFARWRDGKGKTRTAPITVGQDGAERIVIESSKYVARYRDGNGVVRVKPTGCRDEQAARSVLADLERRAELVRSGVMTSEEDAVSRHQETPLSEHFDAYLAYLEAKGACPEHRSERSRQLNRLAADCGFHRLADLDRGKLEAWLSQQARAGMSARTRNSYLTSALAFCNWCAEPTVCRLTHNPLDGIPKANEKADPRRQRRAMEEAGLLRLLAVARERPLIEALTVRKGPRKGERYANVRPEVRERLELLGRERALIYKTLVLTGLRRGELASLTVGQLSLDGPNAFAVLAAADEKNREGNDIPLRHDLAADLRDWLADKLRRLQGEARQAGAPIPARLPADTPVFDVPDKLCKILNRDLRLAGIAKRDERGRVLDVHALRHTFGTLMSKGGVAPRTAQAAMRHSKIDLTMSVYTDPKLLDVRGALDALPTLPLGGNQAESEAIRATGTDLRPPALPVQTEGRRFVPPFVLSQYKPVQTESTAVKMGTGAGMQGEEGPFAVSGNPVKGKGRLSTGDNRPSVVGATGLEPVTPSVSSWCSSQPS